jgi:hypothetical protein
MEYIIQLIALANGARDPAEGIYVKDYDPAAWGGRGDLVTTAEKDAARRFPDSAAATQYWRQSVGTRPDGKPNRPLTAWTVDIQPIEAGTRKGEVT